MTFGGNSNRGPSIAELQRFIRDKTPLVFTLSNGDKVSGTLRWADESAFKIMTDSDQPFTVLRNAVLGYQPQDGGGKGGQTAARPKAAVAAEAKPEPKPEPKEETKATPDSEPVSEIRADDIGS
jgi:hypothetical protein